MLNEVVHLSVKNCLNGIFKNMKRPAPNMARGTDPFIILLGSVPLAMFGAGLFMFLKMPFGQFFTDKWTTSFNIYSQVGLVTLVGLVSKNGILIVQFANELQREGMTKLAAVAQA